MKKRVKILLIIAFLATRIYVYYHPPYDERKPEGFRGYSDVKFDYERYANIWWYGLPPYLKYMYEYPPGAIMPTIFPLFLDQKGVGKYYPNYRMQIMVFDVILFIFLLNYWKKEKRREINKILGLGFYVIGGLIAKDFLYDGLDLLFSGSLAIGLIFFRRKILSWIFFWLSVAVKLMSVPLFAVYFSIRGLSKKLKKMIDAEFIKEAKAMVLGMIIIWGVPLIIFRTSLSVILTYNLRRSFKYCSFPYFIVETINAFTKTEVKIDKPPDFSLSGPYSEIVLTIFNIILPVVILGIIGYTLLIIYKKKDYDKRLLAMKMSMVYIFAFFLSSKIYSQPFPIWTIPLVSLWPFKSVKRQVKMMMFCLLLIVIDTTNYLNLGTFGLRTFWGPLTYGFLRSVVKFGTMAVLLVESLRLPVIKVKNRLR